MWHWRWSGRGSVSLLSVNLILNCTLDSNFANWNEKAIPTCICHFYKDKYSGRVIQLVMSPKLRGPKDDWNFVPQKLFLEISTYIAWICIFVFPLDIYAISSRVPLNFFLSAILHCLICPCSHCGVDAIPPPKLSSHRKQFSATSHFSYLTETILLLSAHRPPTTEPHPQCAHICNCVVSRPPLHPHCKSLEEDCVLFLFS